MFSLTQLAEMGATGTELYSDLFKDVYGSRPRSISFQSVDDYEDDVAYLVTSLERHVKQQKADEAAALESFEARITETMNLVGADRANAIRIIADAEGLLDDVSFYGYSYLEHEFGLPYGALDDEERFWLNN